MAAAISITLDTSQWTRALARLGERAPVAVARGLNKTGASEKTAMSRAVSKDMGIKVGTAKDAISVKKATAAALVCQVVARGKQIPLIEFAARGQMPTRGKGRGVSYMRQGRRVTVRSFFLAKVGNGHIGVFARVGPSARKSRGAWGANLPIKEMKGPSVAHVFGKLIPVGEARRAEVLEKNVAHEIEFELSRLTA